MGPMTLLPQLIAARFRHALGTLTVTGALPLRTTSPAFIQYTQGAKLGTCTGCARYGGGTETYPSTGRYPSWRADFTGPISWSQPTVGKGEGGAARAATPVKAESAMAAKRAAIRNRPSRSTAPRLLPRLPRIRLGESSGMTS